MKTKGFTLIELLVVIVIIGVLVAIALPNFIKIKDKAREAEIKQNLHSIQLAIERYGTDTGGNYPFFLFGGDPLINVGTANALWGKGSAYWGAAWSHPFDMFAYSGANPPDWCYAATDDTALLDGDVDSGFGDTLQYEGYLTQYPRNPFSSGEAAAPFGAEFLQDSDPNNYRYGGWGGKKGDLMFNTGPFGDVIQLMRIDSAVPEVNNDMPGEFFYHPRWADGRTNYGHNTRQSDAVTLTPTAIVINDSSYFEMTPLDDSDDVSSLDVAGYDLAAIGSARTKGQDIDVSLIWYGNHKCRTGYFTLGQERNPYVEEGGLYEDCGDFDERPYSDSIPDFLIIHLSSGIDRKIQDSSQEG